MPRLMAGHQEGLNGRFRTEKNTQIGCSISTATINHPDLNLINGLRYGSVNIVSFVLMYMNGIEKGEAKMKKVHRIDLLRRAVNRNSMLYKILTSYIIIVVPGFTLFAAVLANAFMRNAEHEMQNTTNTMVMQSYNTADMLLKHNFTYYYDLFFEDSDMIRGLYTEDLSAKEDVEIYTYLQKAADNDVITDSIYLYNGTAGKIYSSIPGFHSLNSFYDQEIADIMKNQAEGKKEDL